MKRIFVYVLLLYGCTKTNDIPESNMASKTDYSSARPDASYLPVIFLCGQSNMSGGDEVNPSPRRFTGDPIKNAFIFYKPSITSDRDGKVEVFQDSVNNNWRNPEKHFGPEAGISYFVTREGKKIGIVKYTYGGSKLVVTDKPESHGYWEVNAPPPLNHYSILISNFAKPALNAFRAAGYKPYIAAFAWCLGEADSKDSVAASKYEDKLVQLLDKFKADMRAKDPFVDDMHVIITRTPESRGAYTDVVRRAEVRVGNTYQNGHWLNSDKWPTVGAHYTRDAQAKMHGKAIAKILLQIIP